MTDRKTVKRKPRTEGSAWGRSGFKNELNVNADADPKGRFPANLLVSDDILDDGENKSHGNSKVPYTYKDKKYKVEGFIKDIAPQAPSNYGDSGTFSRYFDLDAWDEMNRKL